MVQHLYMRLSTSVFFPFYLHKKITLPAVSAHYLLSLPKASAILLQVENEAAAAAEPDEAPQEEKEEAPPPQTKKRGRPPKAKPATTEATVDTKVTALNYPCSSLLNALLQSLVIVPIPVCHVLYLCRRPPRGRKWCRVL